jgi:toxin ParE1/3/4
MREIIKQTKALEDLIGIWRYTFEEWGEAQADKYLRQINAGITRLAANPDIGRSRKAIRPHYRSLNINQHVIYYTVTPDTVLIVRVLHGRMDPAQHL